MDLGSIFLLLGLAIPVAIFIGQPLFERQKNHEHPKATAVSLPSSQQEHEISGLLAERDQVINTLQELDFDYLLGKIPEEDYPSQRAVLVQRGAEILRKIDELQSLPKPQKAEDQLEAAISVRKTARQLQLTATKGNDRVIATADDQIEALIALRRRNRQSKSSGFCPKCGGPTQQTDRFCSKCGTAIS